MLEKEIKLTGKCYGIILIILLSAIVLVVRCHQFSMPWFEAELGSDGATLGNCARNFLRYGYFDTKFGAVINSGPVIDGNFTSYIDHPLSLFVFLISISYRLFGVHEWSARIVPTLFSVGNMVMIYIITNKLWDKRTALFSLFFMSLMPMTAYFSSRNVWPYSMGIFFTLLVIWFYVSWIKQYKLKYYYGAVICYTISLLLLWDVYFLGPIVFIYHVLSRNEKKRLAFLFPILSLLVFFINILHIYFLYGDLEQLWNVFLHRTGSTKDISLLQFLSLESYRCLKYFTVVVCFISLVGIWNEIRNRKKRDIKNRLPILLFLWSIPYILLFREGVIHQVNWICTLSPFFALTGGLGLLYLQDSVLSKISCKNYEKLFFWSMTGIAILGCVFLTYYRSVQVEIDWYSRFSFIYIICILLTVCLGLFTWRISKSQLQEFLQDIHPITILLLLVFLIQSLFVAYTLHREKGHKFNYDISKAINENSRFEDAVITSLSAMHYYIPYYADRYIVQNVRTMDDYMNAIKDEQRTFKYYITTNRELMKTKYLNTNEISESVNKLLNSHGVKKETCESDMYMYRHFKRKIVGPWIFYDLSNRINSFQYQ